ncbi:MAG TPA: SPFH domain-containing protein [Planctomycetota bacterium]|nr:SPFH domain-containing protein [Planctomycetota bacterium]
MSLYDLAMAAPTEGISTLTVVMIVMALLVGFIIFCMVLASRYVKVGPNEVLIVSGMNHRVVDAQGREKMVGFRIKKGGGTWIWPILEKAETLSLELMTIDVKTPSVYAISGVPVRVDGVAQIKVKGEDISIRTAAEQFLSKTPAEIMAIAHQTLEGHLRAIIGKMTVEELYKDRDKFAQNVQTESAGDFANMGLQIVSFTIKEVQDDQGYLEALGKPQIAEVKKNAIVGQANADREATIQSSKAHQEGQNARYIAEASVAKSQRDYEIQRADYQAAINQKKADSDLAYDLQKFKSQQAVKVEEMKVLDIEKERQIEIKQKELQATVQRPAEAERYRIQQIADAQKYQQIAEAEAKALSTENIGRGEAEAVKAKGLAEAEAIKAKGLAEAEVILAKGQAEAEAMRKKAEAWRTYNEAAIAQMFIEKLPELARAVAEPLGRTEKITIISNGSDGLGASKITKDIIDVIAQLPPVLEGVSGMNIKDLISRIPGVTPKKQA